jgi:BTB/POZ domain
MATAEDSAMDSPPAPQETEAVIDKLSKGSMQSLDQAVADRDIIYEDGDVLIIFGSRELLVSSKALSIASPVFKTMFNSRFIEGTMVRSVQNPLKLPLPEDDPDAVAALVESLHFSAKRKFLGYDVELEVVQLCDKYDCTTSLYGLSGPWNCVPDEGKRSAYLWQRATIAFSMGNPEAFASSTVKLALKLTRAEIEAATLPTMLPASLKDSFYRLQLFI